jgi:hypothetical protein
MTEWEELDRKLDALIAVENVRRQVEQDKQARVEREAQWAATVAAYHERAGKYDDEAKRLAGDAAKQFGDDLRLGEQARRLLRFGLERRIASYRREGTITGDSVAAELQKQLAWVDDFTVRELAARVRRDPDHFVKLAREMRNRGDD